jgi:hypothetical protein
VVTTPEASVAPEAAATEAAVAYRAYHPAQAYPMTSNACIPPWLWWWWWPNNTGATWMAAGAAVGAGAGTEAACAMWLAPNSIAPATALAPTAPAAIRRAEDSEIDICLLLDHVWELTLRNAKG